MSDELRKGIEAKFHTCPECGKLMERSLLSDPTSPTELAYFYVCEANSEHRERQPGGTECCGGSCSS